MTKKLRITTVPSLKKFRKIVKKRFLLSLLFYLSLATAVVLLLWYRTGLSAVNLQDKEKISFPVNKGDSVSEIAIRLKQAGLIRDLTRFKIYVFFSKTAKKIKVGNFDLTANQDVPEMVKVLVEGRTDLRITIIEGLRQEQIGELLRDKGLPINLTEWQQEIVVSKKEGSIFPDTYFFQPEASKGAVLKTIDRNFQKKVTEGLSSEIAKNKLTLREILTLASIVERESRIEKDRSLVAGILLKRWNKGWALQADATVQYAVATKNLILNPSASLRTRTKNFEWWPKNLTIKDLEINSPYNTYVISGLPPGPICNPGLSSIKAVLNPTDSPYWFYLNDSNGEMHYAKTDAEHVANIRKYLFKLPVDKN